MIKGPTPFREPRAFIGKGPIAFEGLAGKCFTHNTWQYEYKLCPFQNVTQKETNRQWNAFHGLLGIFDEYAELEQEVVDGSEQGNAQEYTYQWKFTDGCACSAALRRSTSVKLVCGVCILFPDSFFVFLC